MPSSFVSKFFTVFADQANTIFDSCGSSCDSFWVGGNDLTTTGHYDWTDNSTWKFNKWALGLVPSLSILRVPKYDRRPLCQCPKKGHKVGELELHHGSSVSLPSPGSHLVVPQAAATRASLSIGMDFLRKYKFLLQAVLRCHVSRRREHMLFQQGSSHFNSQRGRERLRCGYAVCLCKLVY